MPLIAHLSTPYTFNNVHRLFPTDVVGTQLRSLLRANASSAAAAAASRAAGQGGEEDGWSASKALSDAQKLVQR